MLKDISVISCRRYFLYLTMLFNHTEVTCGQVTCFTNTLCIMLSFALFIKHSDLRDPIARLIATSLSTKAWWTVRHEWSWEMLSGMWWQSGLDNQCGYAHPILLSICTSNPWLWTGEGKIHISTFDKPYSILFPTLSWDTFHYSLSVYNCKFVFF